jgi:hypothetical protein
MLRTSSSRTSCLIQLLTVVFDAIFRPFSHFWLITGFVTRLTRRVPLVELELLLFPDHLISSPVFSGVGVTPYLVICVFYCRSLFVLLYFFFWPLCCLFFFDVWILITLWYLRNPRTDIINKKNPNKTKTQRQNNTKIIYIETKLIPLTRI